MKEHAKATFYCLKKETLSFLLKHFAILKLSPLTYFWELVAKNMLLPQDIWVLTLLSLVFLGREE
jgi:hypothetical protein